MTINYILFFLKFAIIVLFTMYVSNKFIALSYNLLYNAGCILKNYRGNEVVFGMGAVFVPILIAAVTLSLFLYSTEYFRYLGYLFAVSIIGFAGLLDDLIGNKHIKGIKNHISSFTNGQLTTGFIKAFLGFVSSVFISYGISKGSIDLLLNIFIIALFTNTLNLMDLRPGRCIKVFMAAGFIVFFANLGDMIILIPFLIILTASLVYLNYDLKEMCILGDTGSNILGITLGYFSSIVFESVNKVIIFFILLTLNLIAEKVSISKLIANNRFLNFLDNLGRSSG